MLCLMIPGFVGDNIEAVLKGKTERNWKELPSTVAQYGSTPEQIFASYSAVEEKYGKKI